MIVGMEFYHLINRGVDKKITFLEDSDYVRFIHDLYVFNNVNNVGPNHRFREFQSQYVRRPLVNSCILLDAESLPPPRFRTGR